MCFKICCVLQYVVCSTLRCVFYTTMRVLQYVMCSTLLCVFYNTLCDLQHGVCSTIRCVFYNTVCVLQYGVCSTMSKKPACAINCWVLFTTFGIDVPCNSRQTKEFCKNRLGDISTAVTCHQMSACSVQTSRT